MNLTEPSVYPSSRSQKTMTSADRNSSNNLAAVGGSSTVNIGSRPTLISLPPMKFLIMDAPRQTNLHLYIKEMKKHSVSDVVRVCEPTYESGELTSAGVCSHDMEYADGHAPPKEVIMQWLQLVDKTFFQGDTGCIAVHCVAGLGRAPVMVAIAMIEFANTDPVEAVALIRKHRRGAINEKQLLYLEGYKRQFKRRGATGSADTPCACIIL